MRLGSAGPAFCFFAFGAGSSGTASWAPFAFFDFLSSFLLTSTLQIRIPKSEFRNLLDRVPALLARAHMPAIAQHGLADARMFLAVLADESHIRNVDRCFLLDDAALDVALRIRPGMPFDHLYPFDDNPLLYRIHNQDAACLAAILSSQDIDFVILLDWRHCRHQITSGASETIFMNFLSRSSRATGPKTRVPIGSWSSLMSTAAFVSNRIYVPSLRRVSFLVRTMTHFTTEPFLTLLSGLASFTEAVMMSPRPAFRPVEPPSGKMHASRFAPELSATSRMVLIWTGMALKLLSSLHEGRLSESNVCSC